MLTSSVSHEQTGNAILPDEGGRASGRLTAMADSDALPSAGQFITENFCSAMSTPRRLATQRATTVHGSLNRPTGVMAVPGCVRRAVMKAIMP